MAWDNPTIVKRKDGGECYCYGCDKPLDGMCYFIVTTEGQTVWNEYDSSKHGKTWKGLVSYLTSKYGMVLEQIEIY